jgi:polypeptide N-acetylgalactosaminyltransferase
VCVCVCVCVYTNQYVYVCADICVHAVPMQRCMRLTRAHCSHALMPQIILVDDFSSKSWLREPLEHHIKFLPKVRLVRLPKRSGLVHARLRGIAESTTETFVILDSHIEVRRSSEANCKE